MLDALLDAEELPAEYRDRDQVLCSYPESFITSIRLKGFINRTKSIYQLQSGDPGYTMQ